MSEFHKQVTNFKDPECLVQALAEQGYTVVEQHEVAQQLYDYHNLATTYLDAGGDRANIIVRRRYVGGSANDLGFAKQTDGTYSAIISEFDSHKHNKNWMNGLKKHYAEKTDMKAAKKSGLRFLGKKVVNGKVQLQFLDPRSN